MCMWFRPFRATAPGSLLCITVSAGILNHYHLSLSYLSGMFSLRTKLSPCSSWTNLYPLFSVPFLFLSHSFNSTGSLPLKNVQIVVMHMEEKVSCVLACCAIWMACTYLIKQEVTVTKWLVPLIPRSRLQASVTARVRVCVCLCVGGGPGRDTNRHYFVNVCPCPSLAERHRKRKSEGVTQGGRERTSVWPTAVLWEQDVSEAVWPTLTHTRTNAQAISEVSAVASV